MSFHCGILLLFSLKSSFFELTLLIFLFPRILSWILGLGCGISLRKAENRRRDGGVHDKPGFLLLGGEVCCFFIAIFFCPSEQTSVRYPHQFDLISLDSSEVHPSKIQNDFPTI